MIALHIIKKMFRIGKGKEHFGKIFCIGNVIPKNVNSELCYIVKSYKSLNFEWPVHIVHIVCSLKIKASFQRYDLRNNVYH